MSRATDEIRRLFDSRLEENASNTFYGEVVAVDEGRRTCKVKLGTVHAEDVLLYGVEKPDRKGMVQIPAIGSTVLVTRLASSNRYYVQMFSEVEKVLLTVGEKTLLQVTENGFTLDRGETGLKKTLTDLIDAIMAMTVSTAVGPSGVPINRLKFEEIKKDLAKYLE